MNKERTIVIASGYFNPLHIGHLRYLEGAKSLGDLLYVIVNNDFQQVGKKGKIIMYEGDRSDIVEALECVDMAIVAVDTDETVCQSIRYLYNAFSEHNFIFANGGDREAKKDVPEAEVCEELGIKMVFDAGGTEKMDSSTNINQLRGEED